jgi:hypothetical protein
MLTYARGLCILFGWFMTELQKQWRFKGGTVTSKTPISLKG